MKRIGLLLFLFALVNEVRSQNANTIQGIVVDAVSQKPVAFTTITAFFKGSRVPVTGAITDKAGAYTLNELKDSVYTIVFESLGYAPVTLNDISFPKNRNLLDLKKQALIRSATTMEAVTVTTQAKLIENKIDRLVFNAEKDVSSQPGTATDVLKKIPQVSVDADGNVQLAGSSGIRFLINGKPSTAFGSSIADVLQTIPASQIKSVEVITNPGAKYDAQGLGGIINIILKTSNAKGYNGNLSLTAGSRIENGSLNITARNNNFGVNAFISGNKRLRSTIPFSSERLTATGNNSNDYLSQNGMASFTRQGFQAGAGFDWTVKKYNNFSGNISFNHFGNKGNGTVLQDLEINKGGSIPAILTTVNSANDVAFRNTDLGFNYKRTFSKEDRELELEVNSSFGHTRNKTFNEQINFSPVSSYSGTTGSNPAKTRETEISLDYTEPLAKEIILGTGGEYSVYHINSSSSALSYDAASQLYIPDAHLSNALYYRQKVSALYAELSFKILKTIQVKAGGRYEHTAISDEFSNAQVQVKVPGYNTFVPSLFFSKKLTDDQTIKLSYSKRIERPDYNALNPFVNTTDPKNLTTGNPYLVPETGHRTELTYNRDFGKKGSVMINLFYRVNEHDIQPYIFYYPSYMVGDSVFTNVSVSTRQNIGTEKNAGMNIFGDLHPNSKLGLRGNVFFFRRHTINTIDKGFNTNSFNYRFNINANYQFTKKVLAEFFGNFNSARKEAQGHYPSFTTYSFAIRKQFWNKKGSLALTANNFLKKYVDQKTILSSPSFSSASLRQIPFRSVGINFSWKFGKLEFKKARQESDNNMNGSGE